jgi:hypothetical protein
MIDIVPQQINPAVRQLVRSQNDRLAFSHSGVLYAPVNVEIPEIGKAVISVIADIASLSVLVLSTRSLHRVKPASDVLQMLGILAQVSAGVGRLSSHDTILHYLCIMYLIYVHIYILSVLVVARVYGSYECS